MAHSAKEVNNFFKKIVNFFYCIFSSIIDRINKIFNLIIKSIYHVQHAYIKTPVSYTHLTLPTKA